jgi:RNA polymerase sigma-70 factor (ECF subfamily)
MTDADFQRHESFLRLFAEHEPAVRGFVRSLLPRREDSRDVMQEIAVVLWRKFAEFDAARDFRKWAFGVARMEVLAFVRDHARDRHVFSGEVLDLIERETAESGSQLEAQREALDECMQKLPEAQRALVNAAYGPEARIDMLAQQRGQTAMSLYKTLHRIRLALIECTRRVLAREGLA